MTAPTQEYRDHRFMIGLVTGTAIGAGLSMWIAPRVRATVHELTRKGQDVRDDVVEAVARGARKVERGAREVERGAHEVERFATAAKTDHVADRSR